jgi:3-deoxy-D-manno-octulosonic-acid transferase
LSLFFYNIFLWLYLAGINLYALFNAKAKKWVAGRKGWQQQLKNALQPNEQRIWIHASSLGEFEQGRPVIEKLKEEYPHYKIVLTFFSPSGYEIRKDYQLADYVFYLPMDGKGNAAEFVRLVNPQLAIFIKYEFWYHYLNELQRAKVPAILISAAFRKEQAFFKWYGGLFRKMLHSFRFLFVQDKLSANLLTSLGIKDNVFISGDTRYDRVAEIASNVQPIDVVEKFKGSSKILIAGSTWPDDEKVLKESLIVLPEDWKMIIAPHEIDGAHIDSIKALFGNDAVRFSELKNSEGNAKRVLIIDNMGMLSSLYAYGDLAFIGGGFQKGGIHNILEPAVFGLPVVFGPVYEKFVEAREMVEKGLAFPVADATSSNAIITKLTQDNTYREALQQQVKSFVAGNIGATKTIMGVLLDNSLIG